MNSYGILFLWNEVKGEVVCLNPTTYTCLKVGVTQIWILNFKNTCSYGCFGCLECVLSVDFMEKKKKEVELRILSHQILNLY